MADWEWVLISRGASKSIEFASVLPATGVYGGSYVSDNETPVLSRTYEALAAPASVVDEMETAFLVRNGTKTILSYSGYVTEFSADLAARGANRWNVRVTLSKPVTDLSL